MASAAEVYGCLLENRKYLNVVLADKAAAAVGVRLTAFDADEANETDSDDAESDYTDEAEADDI